MKRILKSLGLAMVATLLVTQAVLATTYYAMIQVVESNSNDYTELPVTVTVDNDYLADNGYIESTGSDTRVTTGAGTPLPHMLVDNKTLFSADIPADTSSNFYYNFGESSLSAFHILTGLNGYITKTDDPDLELVDDFTIEFGDETYIDTSSGTDKYLVYKENSFAIQVTASQTITAAFLDSNTYNPDADAETSSVDGYTDYLDVGGVSWAVLQGTGMSTSHSDSAGTMMTGFRCDGIDDRYDRLYRSFILFDTSPLPDTAEVYAATIAVYGSDKADDGSYGDLTLNVYQSTPASDDDLVNTDHGQVGTTPFATAIPYASYNTAGWNTFTLNSNGLAEIAVDDASRFSLREATYEAPDVEPTWGDGWDSYFECVTADGANAPVLTVYYYTVSVEAVNVTTGEHKIEVTADGSNLEISIDDAVAGDYYDIAALGGASANDNGNSWIIMDNSTTAFMSYMEYYKHTTAVGGSSLKAWYQPNAIVVGTALVDRQGGDENAVITFDTNPAGVAASLDGLVSYSIPSLDYGTMPEEIDVTSPITDPGWTDAFVSLSSNPLYPVVDMVSTQTGFSEAQVWVIGAILITVILMAIVFKFVPHLLITVFVGAAWTGFMVSLGIFPFWILFIFAACGIALLIWERTPSV